MPRPSLLVVIVAISCLLAVGGVGSNAATTVPATATFGDATTDRIRSDYPDPFPAYAYYRDGLDCVRSQVGGNGFGFRSRTYGCTTTFMYRSVALDFSQPVVGVCPSPSIVTDAFAGGTVDICGSNLVPDVRINAGSMFASSALARGTGVTLVFSNPTNYSGPGGFDLAFEQNVPVTQLSASTRMLTAPATAIAELYQKVPNSGKKISLGRYYVPFSLKVEKN